MSEPDEDTLLQLGVNHAHAILCTAVQWGEENGERLHPLCTLNDACLSAELIDIHPDTLDGILTDVETYLTDEGFLRYFTESGESEVYVTRYGIAEAARINALKDSD